MKLCFLCSSLFLWKTKPNSCKKAPGNWSPPVGGTQVADLHWNKCHRYQVCCPVTLTRLCPSTHVLNQNWEIITGPHSPWGQGNSLRCGFAHWCNTALSFSFILFFISVQNDFISRNARLLDQPQHEHNRMRINIEACLFQVIFFFHTASGQ